MMEEIRVRNYRSIVDTKLDLTYANKRAPRNYRDDDTLHFLEDGGKRVVPILVIYGANSSGKSTLISALSSLIRIVKNGVDSVSFEPNRFSSDDDTLFSIKVVCRGKSYTYSILYNAEEIKRESLVENDILLFEKEGGKKAELSSSLLPGAVVMREELLDKTLFFDSFSYSVEDCFSLYCHFSNLGERDALESVVEIIKKLDLSLDDITNENGWRTKYRRKGRNEVTLMLSSESEGTKRLIAIISIVLASLSSGSLLVADEIDVSLHSAVLRTVVSIFTERTYNSSNAQLICSSHNTDLMDAPYMRADEIAVFEKTGKKGSRIERLSEKGVKKMRKIREKYLEGYFSGVPFPYI